MGKVVKNNFFKDSENNTVKPEAAPADEKKSAPGKKTAPANKQAAPAAKPTAPEKKPAPANKQAAPAAKPAAPAAKQPAKKPGVTPIPKQRIAPMKISAEILNALKLTAKAFTACGRAKAAKELDSIYLRGTRNMFTISVVGEFSRGKSTFINGLLGAEILPAGDLPTTAMLTHIRYNSKDMLVHVDKSGNMISLPVKPTSWEGLVADNFGEHDPQGTVHIGLRHRFLGENNIEILDTPGAGDLEESRAQLIGEALLGSDGAVIAVSADSPLSLTEKTFIKERLLTRKTPFLMLVITKLDTLEKSERARVVDYIIKKLKSWEMDIPVFIPQKIELEDNRYDNIMGYDNIKAQFLKWINDPKRVRLTEQWIAGQAVDVIDREIASLKEQDALMSETDEAKRRELIEAKTSALEKAEQVWDNLCEEMKNRGNLCFEKLVEKTDECKASIIERLQYEIGHSGAPAKWFKDDYPYRLKIELTNMSVSVSNLATRLINEDTRWLNSAFEQNFKARFGISAGEITAEKQLDKCNLADDGVQLANIDKQRKNVKIASTILTIIGATASIGFPTIVWTMGVGTGVSLLSDSIFTGKLEQQRRTIADKIAENVPLVVREAASKMQGKVDYMYEDIVKSASLKKKEWVDSQKEAIDQSVKAKSTAEHEAVKKNITLLEELKKKLT